MSVNKELGYAVTDLFDQVGKIQTPIYRAAATTVVMVFLSFCFGCAAIAVPIVGVFKLARKALFGKGSN